MPKFTSDHSASADIKARPSRFRRAARAFKVAVNVARIVEVILDITELVLACL